MNQKKLKAKVMIAWILIMAAGAVLLFTGITRESLWYDESYTAAIVGHNLSEIIDITGGDSHPPLYYLMLRLFVLIFGNSVLSLRAFSVIGALALASLGAGPVRRAMGERAAIIYTFLTLSTPITYAMAQEARMYTWTAFWVAGSALYGYFSLKEGSAPEWIAFGLFSLAAAYTHYYGLLAVVMICFILFLMIILEKKKLIPFIYVAGAMAAAYLPWLIKLAGQAARVKGRYWIPAVTGNVIWKVLVYPFSNKFSYPAYPELTTGIFIAASAVILYGIVSQRQQGKENARMAIVAAGTYILTICAGIAASYIIRPVLVERYMVAVLGLFIIGLAYGIANLGKKVRLPVVYSLLILIVSGLQIQYIMTNRFNGPMTEAVASLNVGPEDIILHTDEHTFGTFCYYFPDNMNYYYIREGCGGFSNFDAFLPKGLAIGSLDEIGKDRQIWLVQRPGGTDAISVPLWLNTKTLKMEGAPVMYNVPPSWYMFTVYKVTNSEMETANASSGDTACGSLTVRASGFNDSGGNAVVSIYSGDPMTKTPLASQTANISGGIASVVFENLPFGVYAALAFHDSNRNQDIDMRNGTPKEGLGYSGGYSAPMGPPEFEKCKFTFDSNYTSVEIPIYYLGAK